MYGQEQCAGMDDASKVSWDMAASSRQVSKIVSYNLDWKVKLSLIAIYRYEGCYAYIRSTYVSLSDLFLAPTRKLRGFIIWYALHETDAPRLQPTVNPVLINKNNFTIMGYKDSPSQTFHPQTSPGVNCRFHHGFVDEDSMSWLKRSLACIIAANARGSIDDLLTHLILLGKQLSNMLMDMSVSSFVL